MTTEGISRLSRHRTRVLIKTVERILTNGYTDALPHGDGNHPLNL